MKAQLRVLSGTLKGAEFVFSQQTVTIGRHPSSDVQFDPGQDLDVSGRHAELQLREGKWYVVDKESSNGTIVNGYAVTGPTKLDDTDQLRFGAEGPKVEFRLVSDTVPDKVTKPEPASAGVEARDDGPRATSPSRPPVAEQSPTPVAPRRSSGTSATQRIRIEVARQTQSLRRTTLALFAVLVVVSAGFFYSNFRQRQIREAEVAAMRARVDSILSASEVAVQALQGQMQSLAAALENSRTDVRRLRNDLQAAQRSGDAEAIAALQLRLQEASDALSAQQLAAGVDFNAVYEANQRAIAMVWTEFTTGEIVTGTAFAVREDGTMLTNRHVVAGPAGDKTARRVAIKFADSYQVFPGNILRVSDEVDLAVIRVQIRGGVPTVRGLADDTVRPRPGQPAAVIGFPLGSELPMDEEGQGTIARTSLTVGTISKALANVMQLDAWGAEGSSGSPIFDAQGRVISVLYAGQSGGQVVFGVPVSFARDLLGTVN